MKPADTIDQTEVTVAESDDLSATFVFGKTDPFAGQSLADKNVFAPPFDRAVAAHLADLAVGIVQWLFNPRGKSALRCVPMAHRRYLIERLVGTFLIILAAENIEAHLLLHPGAGRRDAPFPPSSFGACVSGVRCSAGLMAGCSAARIRVSKTKPTACRARPRRSIRTARRCRNGLPEVARFH